MAGTSDDNDLEDHMEELMSLEKEDRITSNESFNTFYENRKDVSVWVSSSMVGEFEDEIQDIFWSDLKEIEREFGMSLDDVIEMYTDNIMTFHMNFGDGEIVCNSTFFPNDKFKEMDSEYNLWDVNFNENLLRYVPEDNIAIISQKINIESYFKLLEEYMDTEELDEMIEVVSLFTGNDIEDVLNSFAGSFIANISGFDKINTTTQVYGRYFNDTMYKVYDYYQGEYIYSGGYDWGYYPKDTIINMLCFLWFLI